MTKRHQIIHHIPFVVTHIAIENQFGTKPVWKKEKKILVSDPSKTIIDMLSNPWTGGAIQHVIDCLKHYFKSGHFKEAQLMAYEIRLGNGAVFKRLGFLASHLLGDTHSVTMACEAHLSKGNAQLDPNLKGNKLITRWRLFIPANLVIDGERE